MLWCRRTIPIRAGSACGRQSWCSLNRLEPWPRKSSVDELDEPTARCLVVDLGSLDTLNEQGLISKTVLSTLWTQPGTPPTMPDRHRRAHNVCPGQPGDTVTALATNLAALIAAEGRSFGLYLLTSTQRPQKVHDEVLSQCGNLLLIRMNSEADLAQLRDAFSFVPAGLIQWATTLWQALCGCVVVQLRLRAVR